ncbi:MAG: prepilin peptidase [Hydrogenothermus sp.]|nr:MAG: prepilin peptidase [Hydrogenothermus sp.]
MENNFLIFIFVFAFGTIIGSFLNVLIYRLPRDMSIVFPSSHCPKCGHKLRWYENIPVFSYIFLKGKCNKCKTSISLKYPIVEILTGLSASLSYLKWGISIDFAFNFVFLALVIAISFIDLDFKIIPDELNLIGFLSGLIYSAIRADFSIIDALLGSFVGAGFLFATAYLYLKFRGIEGLGMGDVKLLAFFGSYLGWFGSLFVIFVGSILGVIVGLTLAYIYKSEDKAKFEIPFGPYLSIAGVLYLFFGEIIKNWYLGV